MTSDWVVSDLMLPLWEEVLWPFLDAWDSVRLRTTATQCHAELDMLCQDLYEVERRRGWFGF